jgi:phosphoglycerate dehydrogenase-like enzyme
MLKVLLIVKHPFRLWNTPAWFPERLRRDFPGVEVTHIDSYDRVAEEIGDVEVALAFSLRGSQIAAAPKLRWIHATTAAVHQLMIPEIVNSDIVVTNSRDIMAPMVAEHVLAVVLTFAKKIPDCISLQRRHEWGQQRLYDETPRVREVAGTTLGLVGMGAIGREVLKRAAALGMRVLACREHPEKGTSGADEVYGPERLEEVLALCDYVVLAAPVTPKTENLMNASRLDCMKPTACLINVARGPLIDGPALMAALKSRKLAAAALDVFPQEPLPADSPLWDVENLLITPHTAALTDQLWERHYALFSENLRRYLSGEELLAVVDKGKGY